MIGNLKRFLLDETGATAVEYAMLVALISLVVVSAMSTFANKTSSTFGTIVAALP